MRAPFCLLLFATLTLAQDVPITRLAGVSFKVAELEKARQFYTGILGLEEAFLLKDAGGTIQSVFFKINDDQYLEFSPGAPQNFQLDHVSLLTADLEKARAWLQERGISPGTVASSPDGNPYFAVKDPDQTEIRFVRYLPGSPQAKHRGKPATDKRVSDHLQHVGLAADQEPASLAFYGQKLGFREFNRGGPTPGELRWINLDMPGTLGDRMELMVLAAASAPSRQHIGLEVPDIQRTYKQLLANGLPNRFKPFPAQNPVNRWIMFIRDPNGVRIEFMGEAVDPKQGK